MGNQWQAIPPEKRKRYLFAFLAICSFALAFGIHADGYSAKMAAVIGGIFFVSQIVGTYILGVSVWAIARGVNWVKRTAWRSE